MLPSRWMLDACWLASNCKIRPHFFPTCIISWFIKWNLIKYQTSSFNRCINLKAVLQECTQTVVHTTFFGKGECEKTQPLSRVYSCMFHSDLSTHKQWKTGCLLLKASQSKWILSSLVPNHHLTHKFRMKEHIPQTTSVNILGVEQKPAFAWLSNNCPKSKIFGASISNSDSQREQGWGLISLNLVRTVDKFISKGCGDFGLESWPSLGC